jgi:hypothetical protein
MLPAGVLADHLDRLRTFRASQITQALSALLIALSICTGHIAVWQIVAASLISGVEGKPIEPTSRCTDGAWTFDGTTLRFTREIATAAPDRPMPLVLRVKP